MKKSIFSLVFLLSFLDVLATSKKDTLFNASLETQIGFSTNKTVPFWTRSNQFGSIPASGLSNSWIGTFHKKYREKNIDYSTSFDWGVDLQARVNLANQSSFQLIEGAVKAKWWIFEARLGRTKDIIGFVGDSTLSSGSFAVSGNTLGIPKIEIRIPEYYRLPILDGLISLKGNFAHGWLGKRYHNPSLFLIPSDDYRLNTYYHSKSLYGRIGKESWLVNLYGGINHQAHWGNEKKIYGDVFQLSNLHTFKYVLLGQAYSNTIIGSSKIGNHIGAIDMGLSLDLDNLRFMGYRQSFYDIGAISKLANIRDGLQGITVKNKFYSKQQARKFSWESLLLEYFYSKDQAGYPWSIRTASGDEDYYNNTYYLDGWSYKGRGIGTPLIIMANEAKEGQISNPVKYFISNRVSALHLGAKMRTFKTNLLLKLTFAKHYGNFSTSQWGASGGSFFNLPYGLFVPVEQTSFIVSSTRNWKEKFKYSVILAGDFGTMLNNTVGVYFSIKRDW